MLDFQLKLILTTFFPLTLSMSTWNPGENDHEVIVLTDTNFNDNNTELENSLVMFYAPWCGYCQRLAPEFATAASQLKNDNPHPIFLAKIDCTNDGKETCNKFGVRGYPTLKIFRRGTLIMDYKGSRNTKGIVTYMRNEIAKIVEEEEKAEL